MTTYEPEFWEAGDEHDDATRKLVDEAVRDALVEYVKDGSLSITYRQGGTPVINFCVATPGFDPVADASHERDLGNVLLEAFNESTEAGPEEMADLLGALFETYQRWRTRRTATDPNCDIPLPIDERSGE